MCVCVCLCVRLWVVSAYNVRKLLFGLRVLYAAIAAQIIACSYEIRQNGILKLEIIVLQM